MKKFKDTDVKISLLLMILFGTATIIKLDFLIYGYFTVGSWQLISMIVHEINSWFTKRGSARRNYHLTVAGILLLSLTGLFSSTLLIILAYVMLVAAPFMAIYYTVLCHHELTVYMKRPLEALK